MWFDRHLVPSYVLHGFPGKRWNRDTWHHETWQRGTRSNRGVRAWLNRGSLEQSSPRRAENEDTPLREIFDDVWRTSSAAVQRLSFTDLEAAMYKRRRRT